MLFTYASPNYVQAPHTTSSQEGGLHLNLPATRGGLGHPEAQVDLAFLGGHVCLVFPSHPWHPETFCYNQEGPVRGPLPPARCLSGCCQAYGTWLHIATTRLDDATTGKEIVLRPIQVKGDSTKYQRNDHETEGN